MARSFSKVGVVGLHWFQRTLFEELRRPADVPAPMPEHLVRSGYLGRRTGRGCRDHGA